MTKNQASVVKQWRGTAFFGLAELITFIPYWSCGCRLKLGFHEDFFLVSAFGDLDAITNHFLCLPSALKVREGARARAID